MVPAALSVDKIHKQLFTFNAQVQEKKSSSDNPTKLQADPYEPECP